MKLNGINLNNFYTNKSANIQNRNIKSYQTNPILKTNKADSVSFTGYMDHYNEMVAEALVDMNTFETLHKKGVELQKDAALKKKEALKLRLMYNITANEFQQLYNEMIENGETMTIDDDGNDVVLTDDDSSNQTLVATKDGEPKFSVEFKNGKVKTVCAYNKDGSADVLVVGDNDFVAMCGAVKKDGEDDAWKYKRFYRIYDNNQMICDDGIDEIKDEDGNKILKIKKHCYYSNGKLRYLALDVENEKDNRASGKTKETYYYIDGKLREIKLGEKILNGFGYSCSKSCIYNDMTGAGFVYKSGCKYNPDGSRKFDRVFLSGEIGFYENVSKKLEDDNASVKMAYVYDPQSGKIIIRPNAILTDLPC